MSDEDALLAAIRAHPDEDTPRLVYADWLDEHGRPERAEFIRLQHISEFERTAAQGRRHDQLEREFGPVWLAHLPPADWRFVRGLPESLVCDAEAYVRRFAELTTGTFIRELWLGKIEGWFSDVVQRGWPRSVAALMLAVVPSPYANRDRTWIIEQLSRCPHLAGLRELRLRGFDVSAAAARALAASPHLNGIALLDLDYCAVETEALETLAQGFGPRLSPRGLRRA